MSARGVSCGALVPRSRRANASPRMTAKAHTATRQRVGDASRATVRYRPILCERAVVPSPIAGWMVSGPGD